MRKVLLTTPLFLAGLMVLGASPLTREIAAHPQTGQPTEPATKSIAGKVTAIENEGHSFSIESAIDKETIEFVVNKDTKVQGQIHIGTAVTVAYKPIEGGVNVAVVVTPQA